MAAVGACASVIPNPSLPGRLCAAVVMPLLFATCHLRTLNLCARAPLHCPLQFNCMAEVPMFACAQALQARASLNTLFHVATGVLAGRLLLYTLLPAMGSRLLWMVLGIELLQGVTFALAWNTACVYGTQLAPEQLRTTMQVRHKRMHAARWSGSKSLWL